MKYKKFEVVEMKDKTRATILDIKGNNEYLAEIVNVCGITLGNKIITGRDINSIVYTRKEVR